MEWMRKRIASRKKNIKISELGEHFSYVVVNNGLCYKEDSTKSTRKSNYMEFANIAKKFNMKIDISYYLEQMVRMCICFINEDDS
jgi:hypothetical protein